MDSKKRKRDMTNLDRISELPKDLKEKILALLPVKEAVNTSFLSSEWRYVWTGIPDLVFTGIIPCLTSEYSARASKLTKFVDLVLLLYQGPIQKFVLEHHHRDVNDAIHRWMVILSRNGIRELNISLPSYVKLKMPSSFFSTSSLTDVRLEYCVLKLPQSFYGLKLLKSLQLVHCSIGEKDLENLISSCSHLESLLFCGVYNAVTHIDGISIRIRAPKLKHIHLEISGVKYIHLITPILAKATLHIRFTVYQNKNSCEKILKDTLGSLGNIERLDISYIFMKFLANMNNMELPVKFTCLKKLVCSMDPSKHCAFAVCLFQNAPSLETLEIFALNFEPHCGTFWEPTIPTTLFGNLKFVEIRPEGVFRTEFILPFVKFLLATSPVLVSLRLVIPPSADENVVCLKKLLSFKRASKDAQVFVDSNPESWSMLYGELL